MLSFATSIPTNMDFGSHPCACGLTVRPRRPFGITKSTAEAPRSGTGLPARGAYGLSARPAPPSLRRRGLFLIHGASRSDASRRVATPRLVPPFETRPAAAPQGEVLLRSHPW